METSLNWRAELMDWRADPVRVGFFQTTRCLTASARLEKYPYRLLFGEPVKVPAVFGAETVLITGIIGPERGTPLKVFWLPLYPLFTELRDSLGNKLPRLKGVLPTFPAAAVAPLATFDPSMG